MKNFAEFDPSQAGKHSRLKALKKLLNEDSKSDKAFDHINELARLIFDVPICVIAFNSPDGLVYKSTFGLNNSFKAKKNTIFAQLFPAGKVFVIDNLSESSSSLLEFPDGILFYAGAALMDGDGHCIGSINLMANELMDFDMGKETQLLGLSKIITDLLESSLDALEVEAASINSEKLLAQNREMNKENIHLLAYQEQVTQANSILEGVLDSYELLFKFAPIAIGICSGKDQIIWQANQALNEAFGQGSTLLERKLGDIIVEVNGQSFVEILNLVHSSASPFHKHEAKIRIQHQNGFKNMFVNLSLQPVGRMGDEGDNIMFILADITAEVTARQLVDEANNVLLNAIEDTGMGHTVVEFATGKMTANDQLKANYGFAPDEEFLYANIFEAMLPEYRMPIRAAVQKAIQSNGIYQAEYQVKWRDGSLHWIRAYGKPMYDANGNASHIIGLNKVFSK